MWVACSSVDSDQLLAMFCCLSVWSALFAFSTSLPLCLEWGCSHDTWISRRGITICQLLLLSLINNRCIARRSKLPYRTNQAKSLGWTWQQSFAPLNWPLQSQKPVRQFEQNISLVLCTFNPLMQTHGGHLPQFKSIKNCFSIIFYPTLRAGQTFIALRSLRCRSLKINPQATPSCPGPDYCPPHVHTGAVGIKVGDLGGEGSGA